MLSEQFIKAHSKPTNTTNITHLHPATVGMATEIGSRQAAVFLSLSWKN